MELNRTKKHWYSTGSHVRQDKPMSDQKRNTKSAKKNTKGTNIFRVSSLAFPSALCLLCSSLRFLCCSRKSFSVFRPGGTSDISRWRNHRYRRRWELAPWKGAGPKLWSVALPGLEEFWRLSSGGFSTG